MPNPATKSAQRNFKGVFRRNGVSDSPELRRIAGLPRRDWRAGDSVAELVRLMTDYYKTPQGTMELWVIQAIALSELHDYGGLFAPIQVSGGKTLITFLAPTVLEAERPLLLVPGNLVAITRRKWEALRLHWRLRELEIWSYTWLGLDANRHALDNYEPDLIMADEAHYLKNTRASVTKQVQWYRESGRCRWFVPLTGSPTTRSLHDYGHLADWSLGALSPAPRQYGVRVEWALCMDEQKTQVNSLAPGRLDVLYNKDEHKLAETDPLRAVRLAYQRRLDDTPGVIKLADRNVETPLIIRPFDISIDSPELDAMFTLLRRKWCTPDGHPFSEAVKLWAYCRQLTCGFWYAWGPRPPKPWLRARQEWSAFCRHTAAHNHKRLVTEYQIANACARGEYDSDAYRAWIRIRDTYVPNVVVNWVHSHTLGVAADWMLKNPRGIVWTEYPCFGDALSRLTGFPYHGPKGLDAKKRMIEDAKGPVIASVRANREGRDLQHNWDRNLVISCAPNGKEWDQMLARTHRVGQKAKVVHVDAFLGCSEAINGFRQAIRDAQYTQDTFGTPHKLLQAEIVGLPSHAEVRTRSGVRWKKGIKNGG